MIDLKGLKIRPTEIGYSNWSSFKELEVSYGIIIRELNHNSNVVLCKMFNSKNEEVIKSWYLSYKEWEFVTDSILLDMWE